MIISFMLSSTVLATLSLLILPLAIHAQIPFATAVSYKDDKMVRVNLRDEADAKLLNDYEHKLGI
jgi:hypothetical protein